MLIGPLNLSQNNLDPNQATLNPKEASEQPRFREAFQWSMEAILTELASCWLFSQGLGLGLGFRILGFMV